jgi:hypothetical protein
MFNIPRLVVFPIFAGMYNDRLQLIIDKIAQGDTSFVETFFKKPGGKKYLENITLILINTLPYQHQEKTELYSAFVEILDKLHERVQRQHDGDAILKKIFQ